MPDADAMEQHARRLIEQRLAKQLIEEAREDLERQATEMELPPDLREQIGAEVERDPSLPWDAAEAKVIERWLEPPEPDDAPAGVAA